VPGTDEDGWKITERVGVAALGVAAARAADTEGENPLINDPFARVFLDAVGDGMWNWFATTELPPEVLAAEPNMPLIIRGTCDYMASRTVFFDQFFLRANNAGVRQAVILPAGLDARAWRLPWLGGTTVYELDQPGVLEFKVSTLQQRGVRPRSNLVDVPVDLRQDWPAALQQEGFDISAPSAWAVEGVLPYLPAATQDLLFERIQTLTAAGSRIAVEAPGPDFNNADALERQRLMMERFRALATQLGRDGHDFRDFEQPWYFEDRTDVGEWLRDRGWKVSVQTAEEMMARSDRYPPEGIEAPRNLFVSAERQGP
jgi:methyltransferase (TIGR00027 family)